MQSHKAFTMVELIAAIAIVAILVAVMIPTVGNFVRQSQETADRQTLAVLNDAINRYKMQGGDVSALTSGMQYANLLSLLRTPISWHGVSHQFLRGSSDEFDAAQTIAATGNGNSYRLTDYNTYASGESGESIVSAGVQMPSNAFISVWRTTSDGETITIPLGVGSSDAYNATVYWGDGTTSELTSKTDPDNVHTYATAGDHTITISGLFTSVLFYGGGDCLKLIEIKNWGNVGWKDISGAFYGCSNLTISATDYTWTSGLTHLGSTFISCTLIDPDTSNWDTSNVTNLNSTFRGCYAANPDVSNWNTSKVTNMSRVFRDTINADPDISNWDVSKVTNMERMFQGASGLATQDFSNWDLSSLTVADAMFNACSITTASYDSFLIAAAATNSHSGVNIISSSTYSSAAQAARDALVAQGWTITDAGLEPGP